MLTEFWPRMRTVIGICSVPMTCEVNVKVNTWRLSRPRFWCVPLDECVKWYASDRRRFRMKEMTANLGEAQNRAMVWKSVKTAIFFICYFHLSSTWTNKTFGHRSAKKKLKLYKFRMNSYDFHMEFMFCVPKWSCFLMFSVAFSGGKSTCFSHQRSQPKKKGWIQRTWEEAGGTDPNDWSGSNSAIARLKFCLVIFSLISFGVALGKSWGLKGSRTNFNSWIGFFLRDFATCKLSWCHDLSHSGHIVF